MARDHFTVGIVAARRRLKGPWAETTWLPIAALPAAPAIPVGTPLGLQGEDETFYLGSVDVDLHLRATGHYRDNLTSGRPSLWVVIRPVGEEAELSQVTADPYEGEALAESIGDVVEAVPMPGPIQVQIQAFIEAFHVEQEFFKRKRDRADPDALGRRGSADPVLRRGDEE